MLKSHPDKLLASHLIGVKKWGNHFINLSPCNLIKENSDKELLDSFLLLHDIGKATKYFQKYINGENTDSELKSHALLSAVIFLKYNLLNKKIKKYENTVMLMFIAILKHHGNLTTIKQCIDKSIAENELLERQWYSIDKKEMKEIFNKCGLNTNICNLTYEDFNDTVEIRRQWIRNYVKQEMRTKFSKENIDFKNYLLLQNLYSLLLDSDKSDVVIQNKELIKNINYNINIEKYIKEKCKLTNPLSKLRNDAFYEVKEKVRESKDNKIFTLTLPTGMGKTLNVLNFSFELKNKLKKEKNIDFKIIYSLPFMSIIDQTSEILEEILNNQNNTINEEILLKNHHLAEVKWKGENEEEEPQVAKMLIEGWNSQIIITTFIQLFHTLIGYKNSSQRKFAKMNNAIIILDEIQSLPIKYYRLIRKLLLEFTKNTNSRFILMTATQPKILEEDEHVKLCDSNKYYKQLERTQIINHIGEEQIIEKFVESFVYEKNKSYLFILNTINSSKKLYELLEKEYPDKRVVLLNTNFPPYVRREYIKKIKEHKYDIVVSTQLVEAGVDIDLDIVYRDLAPLPNILQSAGRANREGLSKGQVHIINLVNDTGKSYSSYIYDDIDISLTKEVLKDRNKIMENEFIDTINKYYKYILDGRFKSQDDSIKLIKGINLCKCSGRGPNKDILYAEDFKLIEEKCETISIFIELNQTAKELWINYNNLIDTQFINVWQKQTELNKVTRKMSEFIVTARMNRALLEVNLPPKINGYYYVSKNDLLYYYSDKYGFGSSETIFI